LVSISEIFIPLDDNDDNQDSLNDKGDGMSLIGAEHSSNKEILIMDATCSSADICFP